MSKTVITPRTEALNYIKEFNIETPSPAHMMKTNDLLEIVESAKPKPQTTEEKPKKKVSKRGDGPTVKEKVLDLYAEGKSVREIHEELGTHKSYIYTIIGPVNRTKN